MTRRRGPAAIVVAAMTMALVLSLAGSAAAANNTVKAKLSGKEETHDADQDGKGDFTAKLKKKKKKVCFDVSFTDIGNPTVAHIHDGPKKVSGPPVVTLFEDSAGLPSPISDCVKTKKKLIKKIKRNPQEYYVNLHTDEYPDGAIRGQLKPGG
jgi:hypothetical protein